MDNLKYIQARERRRRKNGGEQHCEVCGTSQLFVLSCYEGRWLCYEHRPGGHPMEEHHIAGLHRGAKLLIPANGHRALTVKMETMLPPRFRSPRRSIKEEIFAMITGATFVSDLYAGKDEANSPFRFVHAPRSAGSVTVPLRDFTVMRQRHWSGMMIEGAIINVSVDD